MTEALAFLWPSFLVAVCLVGIHAYFGIQVLSRNVIFVDLALAQIAALGATVAFMLGHPAQSLATYGYSLTFTLLAAVLLAFTRAWATRVPQEALIGVIYVVAAAASILLIDQAPQGAEHLKQILTGNILTSGLHDLALIVPLYAAIGLLHWSLRNRLTGAGSLAWEFIFYATFGAVVTSSVAIAGVLLVFSFLIIPAAIGVMFASSLGAQLAIGWLAGTLTSAAGLLASFALDLPTGAAMVCAFGASLAIAGMLYPFLRGDHSRALRTTVAAARWGVAALLAASAFQLAAAPRADQPLLDLAETMIPSLRSG
jgi:zinc/manganese transport system permease protein